MLSDVKKNGTGYLYHYAYAYVIGPYVGGLLAGVFHTLAASAHEPIEDHHHEHEYNTRKMSSH